MFSELFNLWTTPVFVGRDSSTTTMDDIQAEIYARRRHMRGVDLEGYQMTMGPRPSLPSARANPNMLGRRITLSQGSEATYARTKSQQPFHQSHPSSTVPRSLFSYPGTFGDHSGIGILSRFFYATHAKTDSALLTQPFNQIGGGSSSIDRDLGSARPFALPANRLQDRSWPADRLTRPFPFHNRSSCSPLNHGNLQPPVAVSTSFRSPAGGGESLFGILYSCRGFLTRYPSYQCSHSPYGQKQYAFFSVDGFLEPLRRGSPKTDFSECPSKSS